jgi:hypothetical protein
MHHMTQVIYFMLGTTREGVNLSYFAYFKYSKKIFIYDRMCKAFMNYFFNFVIKDFFGGVCSQRNFLNRFPLSVLEFSHGVFCAIRSECIFLVFNNKIITKHFNKFVIKLLGCRSARIFSFRVFSLTHHLIITNLA